MFFKDNQGCFRHSVYLRVIESISHIASVYFYLSHICDIYIRREHDIVKIKI
jgi:hypothetical protein